MRLVVCGVLFDLVKRNVPVLFDNGYDTNALYSRDHKVVIGAGVFRAEN